MLKYLRRKTIETGKNIAGLVLGVLLAGVYMAMFAGLLCLVASIN